MEGMVEQRTCPTCGSEFSVSPREAGWFRERGWSTPKHCGAVSRVASSAGHGARPGAGGRLARCDGCGGLFAISYLTRRRCAARGRPLPRRCRACRSRRTLEQALKAAQPRLLLTGPTDLVDEIVFALADGSPEILRDAQAKLTQWAQEQAS